MVDDDPRMKMLNNARSRACKIIDENSALSDEYFAQLAEMDEDTAIERLAKEFLREAADYDYDMEW